MIVFGFFLGLLRDLTLAMTQFCGTDYSQTIEIYVELKIYAMLRISRGRKVIPSFLLHLWCCKATSQNVKTMTFFFENLKFEVITFEVQPILEIFP